MTHTEATHEIKLVGPNATDEWFPVRYIGTSIANPDAYLADGRICWHNFAWISEDPSGAGRLTGRIKHSEINRLRGWLMPIATEVHQDLRDEMAHA